MTFKIRFFNVFLRYNFFKWIMTRKHAWGFIFIFFATKVTRLTHQQINDGALHSSFFCQGNIQKKTNLFCCIFDGAFFEAKNFRSWPNKTLKNGNFKSYRNFPAESTATVISAFLLLLFFLAKSVTCFGGHFAKDHRSVDVILSVSSCLFSCYCDAQIFSISSPSLLKLLLFHSSFCNRKILKKCKT